MSWICRREQRVLKESESVVQRALFADVSCEGTCASVYPFHVNFNFNCVSMYSHFLYSHFRVYFFPVRKKIGDGGADRGNYSISMAAMTEASKDFVNLSLYFVSMRAYCAVFRFTTGHWHDILHWIRLSKMSSLHLRVRAVITHRIGTTGLDPTSTAWWNMHM